MMLKSSHRNCAPGIFGALMLILVCGVLADASILTPENGEQISLVLGDQESVYYRLASDSSARISVTGPGALTLLIRASIQTSTGPSVRWSMNVEEVGRVVTSVDTVYVPSGSNWKDFPLRPSEGFRLHVNVPEGSHSYRITFKTPGRGFAGIRYLFSTGEGHQAKSAIYPIDMLGATSVALKEKEIDFFLADSARAVKVKIVGPTRLRIVTRLAYSSTMKGTQKYSVATDLDGKSTGRIPLETSKSPATYFTNHKEWSVGESRTIYMDIPAGTHEVAVRLASTSAPALAMRFTIPKDDIGD
jgi:hypothetical protein